MIDVGRAMCLGIDSAHPEVSTSETRLPRTTSSTLLSDSCYIGSDANPITLHLTRGTTDPPPPNQPISGQAPTAALDPDRPGVVLQNDAVLVDNAFAAPAAHGCTLLLPGLGLIDPIINLQAGLPSPAGTNEAVQEADGAIVQSTFAYP